MNEEITMRSDEEVVELLKLSHEKQIKQAVFLLAQDLREIILFEGGEKKSLHFYLPQGKISITLDIRV